MPQIILLKPLPDSIHPAFKEKKCFNTFHHVHVTYIYLLLKHCLQKAVIREINYAPRYVLIY